MLDRVSDFRPIIYRTWRSQLAGCSLAFEIASNRHSEDKSNENFYVSVTCKTIVLTSSSNLCCSSVLNLLSQLQAQHTQHFWKKFQCQGSNIDRKWAIWFPAVHKHLRKKSPDLNACAFFYRLGSVKFWKFVNLSLFLFGKNTNHYVFLNKERTFSILQQN